MIFTSESYFKAVRAAFSADRLSRYKLALTDTDMDVVARYVWNMLLSEALYPPLQAYEVVLRNAIHTTFTQSFNDPLWFDPGNTIWQDLERMKIYAAMARLKLEYERWGLPPPDWSGSSELAGRIVAELGLGYWTGLFDSRYDQVLWSRHMKSTFPDMPNHIRFRNKLLPRFEEIRRLRNRVFHHEPVWNDRYLLDKHSRLVEMITYITPAIAVTVNVIDRFVQVFKDGPHACRVQIEVILKDTS
jgi:hypothetical protein